MKKSLVKIASSIVFSIMLLMSVSTSSNQSNFSLGGAAAVASGMTYCEFECQYPGWACDKSFGTCFSAYQYACLGPGGQTPCQDSCYCG